MSQGGGGHNGGTHRDSGPEFMRSHERWTKSYEAHMGPA